ncbi:MAG: hypothetical protein AAF585_02420, partial [Verrucomicrobiota bacterium]
GVRDGGKLMKQILIFGALILSQLGLHAELADEEDKKEMMQLLNDLVYTKGVPNEFEKCIQAYEELEKFGAKAVPILVDHMNDDRQSIHFRNHYEGSTVGDACYWILYDFLQDTPRNYSSYGLQREGRDLQLHVKPYWSGSPFKAARGLAKFLKANEEMSYPEMQLLCLQWLLEGEKKIGASDAESYFINILPLEIRVLERRLEIGEDGAQDLFLLHSDNTI